VDGLPLALELAAARAKVLSLPELADALAAGRFDLLAGGPRAARSQHRTIRASVEWSYQLLEPEERGLLRALAVVAGGCDLSAVAALCPPPSTSVVALDLVDRLLAKSCLVAERQPTGTRYRILETIRQYAAERLAAHLDEWTIANARHAAHYLRLAEELNSRLRGAELPQVLGRMTAEHDNLRAAITWLTSEGADGMAALRLARALWRYCCLRGHYAEGRRWLRAALRLGQDAGSGAEPELMAAALDGAAALAHRACDYGEATALGQRALELYRGLRDRRGTALALTTLGSIAREQADYPRAIRLHSEALALFRRVDDGLGVGHSLQLLGFDSWLSGDLKTASGWSQRALRTLTAIGDRERIAHTLLDRGAEAFYLDDDGAARHLHAARRLFTELGVKQGLAWADDLLALVDLRRGDLLTALDRLTSSLRLHHQVGDRWRQASVLESLARVAASLGAARACGDLLGMAGAIRTAIGAPAPACERELLTQTTDWLRDAAGPTAGGWAGPPSLPVVARHVAELARLLGGR
jgi:tetratricopeptide (TPR) repeat protein